MAKEDWEKQGNMLVREFLFDTFITAVEFINKILPIAEEMNHHPDLLLHEYNKVRVMLTTHSEDKVTNKDYVLSNKIDYLSS
jgi:4a-hydroxytetrahydrobiopterin dehydratase